MILSADAFHFMPQGRLQLEINLLCLLADALFFLYKSVFYRDYRL